MYCSILQCRSLRSCFSYFTYRSPGATSPSQSQSQVPLSQAPAPSSSSGKTAVPHPASQTSPPLLSSFAPVLTPKSTVSTRHCPHSPSQASTDSTLCQSLLSQSSLLAAPSFSSFTRVVLAASLSTTPPALRYQASQALSSPPTAVTPRPQQTSSTMRLAGPALLHSTRSLEQLCHSPSRAVRSSTRQCRCSPVQRSRTRSLPRAATRPPASPTLPHGRCNRCRSRQ